MKKRGKHSLKGDMREYFRKPHVPRKLKKELKKVTVVRTGYPFDDVRMVEREDGSVYFEGKISARVDYKPGVKVNRWTRRARSKVYASVVKAMKHLMQDVGYKFIKKENIVKYENRDNLFSNILRRFVGASENSVRNR